MVVVLSASIACAACASLQPTPLTNVRRDVHLEQDASKSITVSHDMVFYDASPPAQSLRFPAGTYALEGQDGEYWYMRSSVPLEFLAFRYMRSSVPLEFLAFRKGGKADSRNIAGGIMIGKYSFRAAPGAGYIDGEGSTRIEVWKLGGDFLKLEGKDWKKSF
jgi:hypothetical protein